MLNWIVYIGGPPIMTASLITFGKVVLSEATLVIGDIIIVSFFFYTIGILSLTSGTM